MPTDQSHPFSTFPISAGKGGNGLRPYYTPGLNNSNYTVVPDSETVASPYYYDNLDDIIDSRAAARELVNFIVLKYLTTAVTSPFEVSKTLLQVQYTPRNDITNRSINVISTKAENSQIQLEDQGSSDGNENVDNQKIYGGKDISSKSTSEIENTAQNKEECDTNQPPHQIKPIEDGIWEGVGKIVKQPHEGWSSLFKGQYTNWLYEISHLFLQPTLEGTLNDIFELYDDTIPLVHLDHVGPNLATLVASNLIVGFLLSPLELIRTRLQVQSASPLHQKYKGPLHALKTIIQEEGGLRGLYFSQNTLPTIVFHLITPLLQNTTPLIIDRMLNISANDSPFFFSLAELTLNTLEILITLPIDTIRKRIQCQVKSKVPRSKKYEPLVPLKPTYYTGMANAAYSIIKEEASKPTSQKSKFIVPHKKNIFVDWNFRGLYHGFNMQCTSNIILFFLHVINGIEDNYEEF